MMSVAQHQRDRGHTVDFYAMADERNEPATYAADFAPHVDLADKDGGLQAGLSVVKRMVWSADVRRRFDRVLEAFAPDVVHVHNIYHQLSPSILWAAKARGIPIVMTVHDSKLVCPSYGLHDGESYCDRCVGHSFVHAPLQRCAGGSLAQSTVLALEASIHRLGRLYRPISVFICPSSFLAEKFDRAGVFPDRVQVVPHFVEQPAIGADSSRSGVLYAGRLDRTKGLQSLIRAVAEHPEIHLDVAGDGPDRAGFEQDAERLAPGRIRFHGLVSGDAVADMMASAIAVVLPSLVPENFSLTVLEALSTATPVVATDLGGTAEIVADGTTGILVPPGDVQALGAAMTALLGDSDQARRMGEAGRVSASNRFGLGQHLDTLDEIYRSVLSSS